MEMVKIQDNEQVINTFLNNSDIKPKSKSTYKRALKQFLSYLQENNIDDVNRQTIINYKKYLIEQDYTSNTINSYLTALKSLFKYLELENITTNVTKSVKGTKQDNNFKKDPLSIEQVKLLLSSIDRTSLKGKRDFAILNLMINTGLRTIELCRANIEDLQQNTGASLLYIQGKGEDEKNKYVVLTQNVLLPIYEYLQARGVTDEKEALFTSLSNRNNNKRLTVESMSRLIKTRFKNIGLNSKRLSPHSLRHTAITLSLLSGATLQETQALARHKNINTTLIYSHNINRVEQAPELKIDKLLNS